MNTGFGNVKAGERTSFLYITARLVSDVLNPLVVPPLTLLLLGWSASLSLPSLGWIAFISLIFYSIIPLGLTLYLFYNQHTVSLDFPKRESRNRLFKCSILSTSAGSLILFYHFLDSHFIIGATALVFMINPLAGYLINLKWKISVHAAAIATSGCLFASFFAWSLSEVETFTGILSLLILLVLLPLMIWARYYLKLHSPGELLGGSLAGIIVTLSTISIMMRFV